MNARGTLPVGMLLTFMVLFSLWGVATAQGLQQFRDAQQYRSAITGTVVSRGFTPASAVTATFAKYALADFEGARAEIEKVIDQMRDQNEPLKQAAATDFLGVIYLRQGKLGEALDAHRGALQLVEGLGPLGAEARVHARNNLAVAYYYRGDYQRAEDQLTRIVNEGGAPPTVARALNNRGLVYEARGEFDKSRLDFDKARSGAGTDDRLRAQILNNQARVYGRERNLIDAEGVLEMAQKLAQRAGDGVLEADILDSWGDLLVDHGKPAEGLAKLDAAGALEARSPAPLVALSIATSRGKALAALGRHADALVELDRAVAQAATLHVPALRRQALASRGDVRAALDQKSPDPRALDLAIADYRAAILLAQETRERAARELHDSFVESVKTLYESAIKALARRGKPDDLEEAVALLGGISSASLYGQLRETMPALRDADARRALEGARGVLAQETALARQADDAKRADMPPATIAKFEEQLREARQKVQVAVDELVGRYGDSYRAYVTISPLQFRDIKDQLPPRHLLVGYLPTDKAVYIFLVSRESGVQFRQVSVAKAELDTKIAEYRQLVTRVGGSSSHWRIDSWGDAKWDALRTTTVWLYTRLLEPIKHEIARAQHLVLAPTGLLYYLPMHALGPYDAAQGELRFITLDRPVSYLTDNFLLKALGQPRPRPASILALGNPPFQQPGLQPLTYAEEEVRALKALPNVRVTDLAGPAATKPALLAALNQPVAGSPSIALRGAPASAGAGFGFVHLATHGIIDPRKPVESWLALDGTNKLTAKEVPSLDLRGVNLVTLSACETALADEKPGAELMSLATFFGQAGASAVVVSLWSVDDRSTRDLMKTFYQGLLKDVGVSKAQALRAAQISLASKPESRHPFFWAGFIMIGDWR